MKASDLRPGMALRLDGELYVITQFQHITPGNLRAFVQIKIRHVTRGTHFEKRLRSTEEVEQVNLDRRDAEFLFADNTGYTFMDSENYDQFTVRKEFIGDAQWYLKPNLVVGMLFFEGNPISMELPKTVDLKVVDTPPGIKGATATNQLKEATLETGLKTRVPVFIEPGTLVRISTEDGSYLARA